MTGTDDPTVPFTARVTDRRLPNLEGLRVDQIPCVVEAVASLFQDLATRPYRLVGKPATVNTPAGPQPVVGPIPHTAQYKPFFRSGDYHAATMQRRMNDLLRLPPGSIQNRFDRYLALLDVQQLIRGCPHLSDSGTTFLKHKWLETSSIRLGDDGPSILDWSGSYTAPFAEAFSGPRAFLHDPIYATSNNPTPLERKLANELLKRKERHLARAVLNGRRFHRLQDAFNRTLPPTLADVNLLRTAFGAAPFASLDLWRGHVLLTCAGERDMMRYAWCFLEKAQTYLDTAASADQWELLLAEVRSHFGPFHAIPALAAYLPWLRQAEAVAATAVEKVKAGYIVKPGTADITGRGNKRGADSDDAEVAAKKPRHAPSVQAPMQHQQPQPLPTQPRALPPQPQALPAQPPTHQRPQPLSTQPPNQPPPSQQKKNKPKAKPVFPAPLPAAPQPAPQGEPPLQQEEKQAPQPAYVPPTPASLLDPSRTPTPTPTGTDIAAPADSCAADVSRERFKDRSGGGLGDLVEPGLWDALELGEFNFGEHSFGECSFGGAGDV